MPLRLLILLAALLLGSAQPMAQERTWIHLVVGNGAVVFLGLITRGLLS